MKPILTTLFAWMTIIPTLFATGQEGERLYWNGKDYEMLTCPLYFNPEFDQLHKKWEKEWESSTALWRGYVGHWSIENGMLYLCSINPGRGGSIQPNTIPELRKYCQNGRAAATWFSDTLRVVSGKVIFYEHMGFNRNYEQEDYIVVKRGKVISVKHIENKVLIEGMLGNGHDKEYMDYLKELGTVLHKHHPGQSGRIYFQPQYTAFDSNNRPTDVSIRYPREVPNKELARELEDSLRQYILSKGLIPLYLINGKPTLKQRWTIPINIQ